MRGCHERAYLFFNHKYCNCMRELAAKCIMLHLSTYLIFVRKILCVTAYGAADQERIL
jgi:hypothetical protein